LDLEQIHARGANLFHIRDGRVTRLVIYHEGERVLGDLGASEGNGAD
jgi:hypothetical protein